MKSSRFSLQQVLDLKASQRKQVTQELCNLKKKRRRLEQRIQALASRLAVEETALKEDRHQLVPGEMRLRIAYLEHINGEMVQELEKLRFLYKKLAIVRQKYLQCNQDVLALKCVTLQEDRLLGC